MAFLKISPKNNVDEEGPDQIFGVSEFFYLKFVKTIFEVAFFLKIDPRNFYQGKKVFLEISFFYEKPMK